jgi:hypothetical protein
MGCTPVLLYTLGLLPFGLALARFPHVLNVIKEPLLGPPHSHTLYHAPINRLGVTSAPILPRFARLLVSSTKSPRVKKTMQATFALHHGKQGDGSYLGSMFVEPAWILRSIRTIIEATIDRKTAIHVMML